MMTLHVGDVIAIPAGGQFGLAKIIYCSEYFKDVVLIRLFKKAHLNLDIAEVPNADEPADLYYTSADPVRKGLWKIVGTQPASAVEMAMSKRIVGGDVWLADRRIGAASDKDMEMLPKMQTYGHRLIEKAVSRLPSASV